MAAVGNRKTPTSAAACTALTRAPADSSEASEALAACLGDEDGTVRVTAATRLALRADSRGDETLGAYESVGRDSPYCSQLDDVWRHRTRRRA